MVDFILCVITFLMDVRVAWMAIALNVDQTSDKLTDP